MAVCAQTLVFFRTRLRSRWALLVLLQSKLLLSLLLNISWGTQTYDVSIIARRKGGLRNKQKTLCLSKEGHYAHVFVKNCVFPLKRCLHVQPVCFPKTNFKLLSNVLVTRRRSTKQSLIHISHRAPLVGGRNT